MAVVISAREDGSFIVIFDSVENREPECKEYRLFLKTIKGFIPLGAPPVKAQWKDKYTLRIFIEEKFLKLLPGGQIVIEVVPIIEKNGKKVASKFVSIGEFMQPAYLRQKFIKHTS